jgi:hypothetical protein
MNLKDKLSHLKQAWTTLQNQIKAKLRTHSQTLTQTQTKLNEANHKLELSTKENSENEKVLEQLIKEFKELAEELN